MPTNGSGTYSLYTPGNPVVTQTTIASAWANNTLSDLATALTNRLDRTGNGVMLAQFKAADGTFGAPGIAFGNELSTGFYRQGAGDFRAVVGGAGITKWTGSGFTVIIGGLTVSAGGATITGNSSITGTLTSSGALTVSSGGANITGTLTSSGALTVSSGGANITGGLTVDGNSFTTGVLPSMTGNAGKLLTNNGSVASWANPLTGQAAADGFTFVAGSGNQNGVKGTGTGTGAGVNGVGAGASGFGGRFTGVSAGLGVLAESSATNVDVLKATGYIDLSGATVPSSTTGFSSRITPVSIIKAWGRISTNGSGSVSVLGGLNISSVSVSSTTVTVNFATAFSSANYAITTAAGANCTSVKFVNKLAGSCDLEPLSGASLVNPSSTAVEMDFIAVGPQ